MATITETLHSESTQASTFPLQTKAPVVQKPKADFTMTTITLDELRLNEVLVEMKYSGIRRIDLVPQQGLLPMVVYPAILVMKALASSERLAQA